MEEVFVFLFLLYLTISSCFKKSYDLWFVQVFSTFLRFGVPIFDLQKLAHANLPFKKILWRCLIYSSSVSLSEFSS